MPKARVGGRGQGLASAGERKASDRNGATESVACLSEASLQREQRNVFATFWVKPESRFSFKRKEQEKFLIFNLIPYLWRKSNKKNMRTANYPTSESMPTANYLAVNGIYTWGGG